VYEDDGLHDDLGFGREPRRDRRRGHRRSRGNRFRGCLAVLLSLTVLALAVHLFARVAVGDHWLTDVVGSYLLAAGAALLANGLRPR